MADLSRREQFGLGAVLKLSISQFATNRTDDEEPFAEEPEGSVQDDEEEEPATEIIRKNIMVICLKN